MVSKRLISGVVLLGVLATDPAFAADGQRRRGGEDRDRSNEASEPRERTGRAVPRAQAEQYRQAQPQYRSDAPVGSAAVSWRTGVPTHGPTTSIVRISGRTIRTMRTEATVRAR